MSLMDALLQNDQAHQQQQQAQQKQHLEEVHDLQQQLRDLQQEMHALQQRCVASEEERAASEAQRAASEAQLADAMEAARLLAEAKEATKAKLLEAVLRRDIEGIDMRPGPNNWSYEVVPPDSELFESVYQLLTRGVRPQQLSHGLGWTDSNDMGFRVVTIKKLRNPCQAARYASCVNMTEVPPPDAQQLDPDTGMCFRVCTGPDDKSEYLLLHGTPFRNIPRILENGKTGLDPAFCLKGGRPTAGHMYGPGVYMADNISKAVAYSRPVNGVITFLLVLACLGNAKLQITQTDEKACPSGYDSLVAATNGSINQMDFPDLAPNPQTTGEVNHVEIVTKLDAGRTLPWALVQVELTSDEWRELREGWNF